MAGILDLGAVRFNYTGLYSSTTKYSTNDVVRFNAGVYVYVASIPATGVTPADTARWKMLVPAGAGFSAGTFAARPAAGASGQAGSFYLINSGSDVGRLYVDDGTSWTTVNPAAAAPAATALSTTDRLALTGAQLVTGLIVFDTTIGRLFTYGGATFGWVAGLLDVQTFTASGTWTKPTGAALVHVYVVGGGTGGGQATSAASSPGGGGGEGYYRTVPAAVFDATEPVVIGAGGLGSTAIGGASGGNTTFGKQTSLQIGALGGQQNGAGGGAGNTYQTMEQGGNGNLAAGGSSMHGGGGGGSATNNANGQAGGVSGIRNGLQTGGGGTAGNGTTSGGAGTSRSGTGRGGDGGGSGFPNGGAGGIPGGGGGAAVYTGTQGTGGNGARGECRVLTLCM